MSKIFSVINPDDSMLATVAALEELLSTVQVQDSIQITCSDDQSAGIVEQILENTQGVHHGSLQPALISQDAPLVVMVRHVEEPQP